MDLLFIEPLTVGNICEGGGEGGGLILASWDMGAESGLTVVCFLLLVIKDKSRGNWSHIS